MRRIAGLGLVLGVAAWVFATFLGITAASAEVVNRFRDATTGSADIANFCGSGIEFRYEYSHNNVFIDRTRTGSDVLYAQEKFHSVDTFTNLSTGKSVTFRRNSQVLDQRISIHPDGTFTIVQQHSGNETVTSSDGIRLKGRGVYRVEYLVDYNGTLDNPEDDLVLEDGVVFRAGKYDLSGRDLCAESLRLTA